MSSQTGTPWIDEDPTPKSKSEALRALAEGVASAETPAEKYLREDRRIDLPHPDGLKYWSNARTGEGALLAPLYAGDKVVAVQAVYLDRDGHKSPIDPAKQRLSLERAPGAVFQLPYDGDSKDVVVAEGLEDALTVWRYGAVRCRVIGLPGIGALKHLTFPESTRITVIADGDPPGSKGAELLQKGLDALILQVCEVLVAATPPEGWDANRLLAEHGVETLKMFLASVRPAELSDRGEIRKLAKLDLLAYAQVRKQAAEELKPPIPVTLLDKIVEKERQKIAEEAKAEKDDWVGVNDTRPWAEEVDGAELLDELYATLGDFVIMSDEARCATALWIVFTYVFEAAYVAPKLWIHSPTKKCGKTRLVKVLRHLVKKPLSASRMSPAAFYRLVEARQPTLLLDDFDSWASTSEDFRNILNAGFDKGDEATVWVCTGDNNEPTPFSVWCPQVISGIGQVKDTVADRCIKIALQRKLRSQKVASTRRRHLGRLQELAQKCVRWADDNLQELHDAEPDVPEAIDDDRAADGWELLLAVADHCGGHWKDRARQAAIKLSGSYRADHDGDIGTELLKDIRAVLEERGYVDAAGAVKQEMKRAKVRSLHLVGWLVDLEDRPWREFIKDRPLTPTKMATILRDFRITPRGDRASRGYRLDALAMAFERYLSPLSPDLPSKEGEPSREGRRRSNGFDDTFSHTGQFADFQPVNPSSSQDFCGSQTDSNPSHSNSGDGLKTPRNPQESSSEDGLTGWNPTNSPLKGKVPSNGLDEDHERSDTSRPEPTSIADEARRLARDTPLSEGDGSGKTNGHDDTFSSDGPNFRFQTVTSSPFEDFCGFRSSPQDQGYDLKKPQNPSKTANGNGVTLQNPEKGPSEEEGHKNLANGDYAPVSIAEEARRLKRENPSWSDKRIAAELGQPEARIARYLAP